MTQLPFQARGSSRSCRTTSFFEVHRNGTMSSPLAFGKRPGSSHRLEIFSTVNRAILSFELICRQDSSATSRSQITCCSAGSRNYLVRSLGPPFLSVGRPRVRSGSGPDAHRQQIVHRLGMFRNWAIGTGREHSRKRSLGCPKLICLSLWRSRA
jgi:hypothetical protein